MANFFLPNQRFANSRTALFELVRFLCNESLVATGPGYTVVEADDGTNRNAGPNLSDLGGSNAWNPANATLIPTGSWIVLESLDSHNTNHFQWLVYCASDTQWQIFMIPLEDFSTGGGSTGGSLPTLPATAYGDNDSGGSCDFPVVAGVFRLSCTATEGNIVLLRHSGEAMSFYYGGEVDSPDPLDVRPYVQYFRPDLTYISNTGNAEYWIRLSPVDNTTIIGFQNESGVWAVLRDHGEEMLSNPSDYERSSVNGADHRDPCGVIFRSANISGHTHFAGFLRNVRTTHGGLGRARLSSDRNWLHFTNEMAFSGISMLWDGSTAYG